MKTTVQVKSPADGSILIIALVLGAILCLSLLSYLSLVYQQNSSVARSQAWNAALAAAEAGVEEAFAQLNPGVVNFNITDLDHSANGWGTSADGFGPVSRNLLVGDYSVSISADEPPTITSRGHATVPSFSANLNRRVRVRTKIAPAFQTAMAAHDSITFNGTNIKVDSYDSADPNYSTPQGMYDPAKRKAGGDVASQTGLVNVGNADVNGKVLTGPTGSANVGPGGFAGDLSWTGPGIQPGWYRNDFNADFPDVQVPYTSGMLPPSKTPGPDGTNYTYYLMNNSYIVNGDVDMKANGPGDKMFVGGNATLYVTGTFSMANNPDKCYIYIAPGGKLKLFVGGASADFYYVNTAGNANTFQYYGLPTNLSVTWSGNAAWVGTVYAPEAAFTLNGSGNPASPSDFQGGCVVRSVTMNGHFNFHYDENLRRAGPWSHYVATRWEEISPL